MLRHSIVLAVKYVVPKSKQSHKEANFCFAALAFATCKEHQHYVLTGPSLYNILFYLYRIYFQKDSVDFSFYQNNESHLQNIKFYIRHLYFYKNTENTII